jgi:acetyltransferase
MVSSADEALEIAKNTEGEVALKIVSPDILHKSDAKGVRLHLKTANEIRAAFNDIIKSAKMYNKHADIRGVLVTPMADPGIEVIIGTKIDDQFGPVIMFGLGGIMVEVLKDVTFRVLPISSHSAKTMMGEIRSAPILNGVRGNAPYDKRSIRRLLVTCSEIVQAYPEIAEIDLNPVIVYKEGARILDARILLKNDVDPEYGSSG